MYGKINTMKTVIENKNLHIIDLGTAPYAQALDLQLSLVEKRIADTIPNTILILEHQPVITLGARKTENKLLAPQDLLTKKGIEIFQVGRGGGTTAHNPGQLVIYPIIKLKSLSLHVNEYIRTLEQLGIELLKHFCIPAERIKGKPGLWISANTQRPRKIASVGVKLKRFVSFHGIAINISNDLSIFDYIVPCGLDGVEITSVSKETSQKPNMQSVKKTASEICTHIFSTEQK